MANECNRDDSVDSIVSVEWLAERLGRPDIVIADCRFELADVEAGRRAYERDHMPGAVFFDLEQDLSLPGRASNTGTMTTGGRHPLPTVEQMAALFSAAGIDDHVTVVCYDDQKGGMAGRLWWMLRYLGHQRVALLDGGYAAWRVSGYPITSDVARPVSRSFVPRPQQQMIATMDDVRRASSAGQGVIVDSRAPERYLGEVEPLDPVAGHIPGTVNMPWQGNVGPNGLMLDTDALTQRFASMLDNNEGVIVHCGSGVTGCLNVLAMERAGVPGVKLYVGGWSDWCSHADNPVATGAGPHVGADAETAREA